ncbi:MAG: inositol monophosphatase family protein [Bacteroidales bacterium]|nr:inositol monophosphatase family protein [Bacteroidales bacterium]
MSKIINMNIQSICEQVITLARETGGFIRTQRKSFSIDRVESKGLHDFVSYVDKESEKKIVAKLKGIVPQAGFIAEEGTGEKNPNGLNWIIDPLDGTTNFIHGLPPYAISIALMDNDQVILGVIYEVTLDECFYSWGENKAFLNGNPITVSSTAKVSDSLIATGFPYYDYERMEPFLRSMEHFMRYSHGLRRIGSAATDLAYVACGRFDSFYEYSLQPWDVAAGSFIVEQAGGKVCDFSGTKNYIFGKEIIAANSKMFDEFRDITSDFLKK